MPEGQEKIAIFGGSFNPPTIGHRNAALFLSTKFDQVIVVPCGGRTDKAGEISHRQAVHRLTMCTLTFYDLKPNVVIDFFDIARAQFTRTLEIQKRYEHLGEIWHVVGCDLVMGGADGCAEIQKKWEHGVWLWENLNFAILPRAGYQVRTNDYPPHHEVFWFNNSKGSSTKVREVAAKKQPLSGLVLPDVETYIKVHHLYE